MDVVHRGWLVKSPPGWKGGSTFKLFKSKWRKRYFVLFVPPILNSRSTCVTNSLSLARVDSGATFGPQLCYYDNEQLDNQHGKIDLRRCEALLSGKDCAPVRSDCPFLFALRMRSGSVSRATGKDKESVSRKAVGSVRTYYMSADNESSMNLWIMCLKDVFAKYGIGDVDAGLLPYATNPISQPAAQIKITHAKLHHSETFQQPRTFQPTALPPSKQHRLSIFVPHQTSSQTVSKSSRITVARNHSKSAADLSSVDCDGQSPNNAERQDRSKSPIPPSSSLDNQRTWTIKKVSRLRSSLLSLIMPGQSHMSPANAQQQQQQQQQESDDSEEADEEERRRTSPTCSEADIIDDNERQRVLEFDSKSVSLCRRPSDLSAEVGRRLRTNPGPPPGPPLPARTNIGLRTPLLFAGGMHIPDIRSTPATPSAGMNVGRRLPPLPMDCGASFLPWKQQLSSSTGREEVASRSSMSDDISNDSDEYDSDYDHPPIGCRPGMSHRLSGLSKRLSEENSDMLSDAISDCQEEVNGTERRVIKVADDVIYDIPRRLFSSTTSENEVDGNIIPFEDNDDSGDSWKGNPLADLAAMRSITNKDDDLYDYLLLEPQPTDEDDLVSDSREPEVQSTPPFLQTTENDEKFANCGGIEDDDQYDYPPFVLAAAEQDGESAISGHPETRLENTGHVHSADCPTEDDDQYDYPPFVGLLAAAEQDGESAMSGHLKTLVGMTGDVRSADSPTSEDDDQYDYPPFILAAAEHDGESAMSGHFKKRLENTGDVRSADSSADDDQYAYPVTHVSTFGGNAVDSAAIELDAAFGGTKSAISKDRSAICLEPRDDVIAVEMVGDECAVRRTSSLTVHSPIGETGCHDNDVSSTEAEVVTSLVSAADLNSNQVESLTLGGSGTDGSADTLPICILIEAPEVPLENTVEVAPSSRIQLSPTTRSIIDSIECNQRSLLNRRAQLQSDRGNDETSSSHDTTCRPVTRHHSACSSIGKIRPPVPSKPFKRPAINGNDASDGTTTVSGVVTCRQVARSLTLRESIAAAGAGGRPKCLTFGGLAERGAPCGSVTNQRHELMAELEQLEKIRRVSQNNNET